MSVARIRIIFAAGLVVSLAGIALCDAWARDWKTCVLGVLFATANVLIFLVR